MHNRALRASLLVFSLGACPGGGDNDDASAGTPATTTGDEGGGTLPTDGGATDPGFNPNFLGILSGTTLDAPYTKVRVGQLDLAGEDGCCADYVLAGPAQNHVRILFGATSRGLLFLSDVPDQTFTMGPANVGIEDLIVADYDEDGHDDVLALRSDGVVGIRRGLGAAAPAPVLDDTLIEAPLAIAGSKGSRSLALADVDCDGKRDLLAVSPDDDRVLYALAAPGGGFAPVFFHDTGVGTSPRQVVVGDLNGDGQTDIVTGNANGSASVLLNDCATPFDIASNYPIFVESFETPDMQVAIGRMCIGETTRDWPAIALGHGDRVWILCGNSEGTFDQIGEEPSAAFGAALDYMMDSNEGGDPEGATVFQLEYWEPTLSLHVLWSHTSTEISRFLPSPQVGSVGPGLHVADLAGRKFIMGEKHRAFVLHRSQAAPGVHWTHIIRLVQGGPLTDVSFAR